MTIAFRPLRRDDFPLLRTWLEHPHVAHWWNHETGPDDLERDFGGSVDGTEPGEDLLAMDDGVPVGLVQRSRLVDYADYLEEFAALTQVPYEAVTIDYLVGDPGRVGQGLGTAMIRAAVADTWATRPGTGTILVAVVAANTASWRALEKAGFRRVAEGPMEPDNPLDDPLHYVYRQDRGDDGGGVAAAVTGSG
ncbi:GNAT family N-acetyltransferase [Jiangella mangrovi]|uniref:Aminoglycoside 6'-N-acetyltransferase n=1 Tax=Jiangella mangrovi TaxID=1524084 RepID=A0A7W9GL73_9ACTN|nr:GNAT family N-acetyltransferase [Jiangella mangrovi]MBB5785731.1 aminoglycoside 6'-N-acetyltransferase [Jiangella mangrovi]